MAGDAEAAVVRRVLNDVWSEGDLAAADELYAADFVSHQHSHPNGPKDVHGVAEIKAFAAEFRAAFPDFHDRVLDQVVQGDKVVTRYTSAGTQTGVLLGIAPTGRRVEWVGITIDRVVDGQIRENWVCWDMLGMLQQLGAVTWTGAPSGS